MVKVSLNYLKICLLTLVVSLTLVVFPKSFSEELGSNSSNILYMHTIVNVDDINFNEGKLTQGFFRLRLEANKSFGVFIFSPSIQYNNLWDDRTSYLDGWYSLSQQYFTRGLEENFNFNEWIFCNEVLEYGILFGVNITIHKDARTIRTDLNPSLQDEWAINGTIEKVSKEEGARYAVYGMETINSSIQSHNIKELYLLRVQISRKLNVETFLIWIPPFFMLALLIVSGLLIYRNDLANSLRVYLAVVFFSFSYLSMLKEITPPKMTSIETVTLFDATLCLILAIIAIVIYFQKSKRT